jgi:hypothetical protein
MAKKKMKIPSLAVVVEDSDAGPALADAAQKRLDAEREAAELAAQEPQMSIAAGAEFSVSDHTLRVGQLRVTGDGESLTHPNCSPFDRNP